MAVTYDIADFACPTSTGNQDLTISGFGTVKTVLIVLNRGTTIGTKIDHNALQISATDLTNHRTTATASDDNVGTTDANRANTTDKVISFIDSDGTVEGAASYVSTVTDGIRINWTTAPSVARKFTAIFFGGDDLSANVGSYEVPATIDQEVTISGLGFEPDVIIHFGSNTDFPGSSVNGNIRFGFSVNNVGLDQVCNSWDAKDGETTSQSSSAVMSDRCFQNIDGATLFTAGYVSEYNADGFKVQTKNTNSSKQMAYLALNFNSTLSFSTGIVNSPTSTGNQSISSLSFKPGIVLQGLSNVGATDTGNATSNGQAFGISLFTDSKEYCHYISDQDSVGTQNSEALIDDQSKNFEFGDGTVMHAATHVSMNSDGWTENYTTADNVAARKWTYLAIESTGNTITGSGSPSIPILTASGSGTVFNTITGSGSPSIPVLTASGSGSVSSPSVTIQNEDPDLSIDSGVFI